MTQRPCLFLASVVAILGISGCEASTDNGPAGNAVIKWDGPSEEIASSDITRNGKVYIVKMSSRIDVPPSKVWAAMKHPEMLSKYSDQYRKSDILKDEGSHKELEFHVVLLDNLQQLTMAMDFDDAAKTLKAKTLTSTIAEIDGIYSLVASPDGQRTLYVYNAKEVMKGSLLPADHGPRTIKETFVTQLRAIKNQLAAGSD
jgi:hypothetical protein